MFTVSKFEKIFNRIIQNILQILFYNKCMKILKIFVEEYKIIFYFFIHKRVKSRIANSNAQKSCKIGYLRHLQYIVL